ncbi:hypothetical protein [Endozoicomonas sp.]|uniref:hypothetical protein n=1 Tax=Endozoicomonas sp. TaxID=1892382 RepID=UPI003AF6F4CF
MHAYVRLLFLLIIAFSPVAQSHQERSLDTETFLNTSGLAAAYQNEPSSEFKPERVHLVDYNEQTGNYLFRGNMPLNSKTFAYHELMGIVNSHAIEQTGSPIPEMVRIIDISLINTINPNERRHLAKEHGFFDQNKELGEVIHYPVYGIPVSVKHTHRKWRKHFAKKWGKDKLESLVNNLKRRLDQDETATIILYVHCEAGFDRTGELIAAYQLRHQGKSYHQAYQNAVLVAGRQISSLSKHGLQWYAYYLKEVEKLPTIGDI